MNEHTPTVRSLRQALTAVENQELTVRELRTILFAVDAQDQEVTKELLISLTRTN